jgi:tRNA A-37 threonylcarbamoyl transferase component Bud32
MEHVASQLDEILNSLIGGRSNVDEACRAVAAAARANPAGTQLWPMLIEARVTQQQITAAVGRVLCEALENFEPEKTMWLAPKDNRPDRVNRQQGEVLRTPVSKNSPIKPEGAAIESAEQLRAFLWDSPSADTAVPGKVSIEHIPTLVAPPRAMPGVTPALPPLELGTVVKNRYRIEAQLGYGGIGQVFLAIDTEVEREGRRDPRITLKLIAVDLKREPQALMAMKIAVARIKSLRHPNIVTTYGVETDNDRLFVTMEPLFGRWLGERIRAVRNVGVAQEVAWPIVEGIANGLDFAHKQGIVHSDLSPYAVFLAEDGTPKIVGFGLIHALPTSNEALDLLDTMTLRAYSEAYATNVWATHGTPQPSDDLYPLGVIAYELLTGKHPFQRRSLSAARQKDLVLAPIPGLKRRAAKLIAHCLSFERKDRPSDAARFLRRLYGPVWLRALFGGVFSVAAPRQEM